MTGVSKRFGTVQALSDVRLYVRPAKVHALVGENGAGKSTLMKILAGAILPDTGSIVINGRCCRFKTPAQAIEGGVAMIYQELNLAEDLTVAENVFLGCEIIGRGGLLHRQTMTAQTAELAARYGFRIDPDAVVRTLSAGSCQIVEILKALHKNARILVMDEPTSSLSEHETATLMAIIRRLREQNISVIYISHRLEEIIRIADDVTILRDGAVVHSAPVKSLDITTIVHHMVGRKLKDFFPARQAHIGGPLIRVEHLCGQGGIDDISFEIRSGQITGMAGLVGAGRTETAQLLFGVRKQTGGRILLDNQPITIHSPQDAIRCRIAFLPEDRKRSGLCLNLPCDWNITLPNLARLDMKILLKPGRERAAAVRLAERLHIKWLAAGSPAETLSGGNQQKLLIARWLLAESRFLIFDEPTRGVDVGAKKEIYGLLNELAEAGKAILFISSELPELFGIADRILVMRRKKLVADLSVSETTPDNVMHLAAVQENIDE